MKLFGQCEVPLCNRYRFFIRIRHLKIPGIGWTTSNTRQCGHCARKIKRMTKNMSQSQDGSN